MGNFETWNDPHSKYEAATNPAGPDAISADGTEVGLTPDEKNKDTDKSQESKNKDTMLSPEDYKKNIDAKLDELAAKLKKDPSMGAAQESKDQTAEVQEQLRESMANAV